MLGVKSDSFLYIRVGKLTYSISSLVLYTARCMLGVKSVSYSIFSLVLYSARVMLKGVNSVQLRYHARSRKVTLERAFFFLSV